MSNLKNSRVQSNLLQQNCFVRDVVRTTDLSVSSSPESFLSIDEVVTSKGVELKETDNPYPITPQYVKSFADSVDYHKDLLGAISSGERRSNLGDITDIQKIVSMDSEQARALYNQLSAVFAQKPVEKSVETSAEDINGGNS